MCCARLREDSLEISNPVFGYNWFPPFLDAFTEHLAQLPFLPAQGVGSISSTRYALFKFLRVKYETHQLIVYIRSLRKSDSQS